MKKIDTIKRFLEVIASIIFEYITLIITIAVSAYIVYNSQVHPYDNNTLLLWIIGLLGMIATASISEKHFKLSKIDKDVVEIKKAANKPKLSIDEFICRRQDAPKLESLLFDAHKITITGGSLSRVSDEYYGLFENKLKNGSQLEIIMVEPFSSGANHLCDNVVYETDDHEIYSRKIQDSLNRFFKLQGMYKDNISIRLTKNVPPFSLIVIDENTPAAKIKVELYSYSVETRDRIQFMISINDVKSYSFFIDQLKCLREESYPVDKTYTQRSEGPVEDKVTD